MALSHSAWLRVSSLLLLLALPGIATAEMLDEPACKALKDEQAKLAAEGLKTDMLHGPDWAKANLPASRLEQIKQLMDVEEKIAFRCPLPPPPKPVEPVAAAPAGQDPAAATAGEATPKKRARKKREDTDAAATESTPTPQSPAPAKKKQKAKKKEPTNDAYVPPPPSGNAFVDGEAGPVPQPSTQQLAP